MVTPDPDRSATLADRLQPGAGQGLRGDELAEGVVTRPAPHLRVLDIDEGYSADKIAFWIGDTPQTVRLVYAHMLEASSAPAAAAMDAALGGFDEA